MSLHAFYMLHLNKYINLLNHIKNVFVVIQPYIVIGNSHCLKGYCFRILEVGIRPPHVLQPLNFQQSVFGRHVFGQS